MTEGIYIIPNHNLFFSGQSAGEAFCLTCQEQFTGQHIHCDCGLVFNNADAAHKHQKAEAKP